MHSFSFFKKSLFSLSCFSFAWTWFELFSDYNNDTRTHEHLRYRRRKHPKLVELLLCSTSQICSCILLFCFALSFVFCLVQQKQHTVRASQLSAYNKNRNSLCTSLVATLTTVGTFFAPMRWTVYYLWIDFKNITYPLSEL